ncbi:hypothetical protein CKAN_01075600 [Cinnamomum micranthum f. kanehirae]|uniref:Uncharacterized protein n=1 Tax=Cinnamomum micranthum f. kanehirae TaxID=337451 RepID=A0A443NU51_9MAGN|nr:hypothetical protein CKAN_01075600 [Cinnamomum micranthum f. kanehirae]
MEQRRAMARKKRTRAAARRMKLEFLLLVCEVAGLSKSSGDTWRSKTSREDDRWCQVLSQLNSFCNLSSSSSVFFSSAALLYSASFLCGWDLCWLEADDDGWIRRSGLGLRMMERVSIGFWMSGSDGRMGSVSAEGNARALGRGEWRMGCWIGVGCCGMGDGRGVG